MRRIAWSMPILAALIAAGIGGYRIGRHDLGLSSVTATFAGRARRRLSHVRVGSPVDGGRARRWLWALPRARGFTLAQVQAILKVMGSLIIWLWFTVLFANFAEAIAEGRGKAQADALRRQRTETQAKLLSGSDRKNYKKVRPRVVGL